MAGIAAYIMITVELGAGQQVVEQVSLLPSVHWAAMVTGAYDVIAGVRVPTDQALGDLVVKEIHNTAGVTGTITAVISDYYKKGQRGKNGGP